MKQTKQPAPKPDMMFSIREDVLQDLTNLEDDVENCFDVAEDVSREDIKKMVMAVIVKAKMDVKAALTGAEPDVDELVKDMSFVEDVLYHLRTECLSEDAKEEIQELAGRAGGVFYFKVNNLADELKVDDFIQKLYPLYSDQQSNVLF